MNRLRLSILLVLLSTASAPPALALGHHHAYANKYQKTIAKRQKKEQKRQAKAIKAWRKQHNVSH